MKIKYTLTFIMDVILYDKNNADYKHNIVDFIH